jgi:hypothetical protein
LLGSISQSLMQIAAELGFSPSMQPHQSDKPATRPLSVDRSSRLSSNRGKTVGDQAGEWRVRIPTQSVHVYRLEVVPGSDLIPSTLPT